MKLELDGADQIRRFRVLVDLRVQHSAQASDRFERGVTQKTGNSQQSPEADGQFLSNRHVTAQSTLPAIRLISLSDKLREIYWTYDETGALAQAS